MPFGRLTDLVVQGDHRLAHQIGVQPSYRPDD